MTEQKAIHGNKENENLIFEQMQKTKLHWSVREEMIQTASGIVIPDKKAIIRNDNDVILGTHGKSYSVFQNEQMFELLHKISQSTGLEIHRGGYFGQGEKTYIQFKSEDLKIGNDKVEGYLTGINSYDGSTALCFGASTLTVSCTNTFYGVMKSLSNRMRHTTNMMANLDMYLQRIEESLQEEQIIFHHIKRFSETEISQADIQFILRNTLDIGRDEKMDDLSTRKKNLLSDLQANIHTEVAQKGENVWGLFSGLTRFTTHSLRGKKSADENKLFGRYGEKELQAFQRFAEVTS